jgi:Zn-dependent peptidase ImmA (M78 family)/transcriptional regulator with XRE-family HTH domain
VNSQNLAFVTPSVVRWAIGRSGKSKSEIAKKLGVTLEEIEHWERGKVHPAFSKAEAFAELCHIPFGYLFLPDHPKEDLPLPDFRTQLNRQFRSPSVGFSETLSNVLTQQQWYREHLEESGAKRIPFVSKYTLADGIETVAADIRHVLVVSSGLRWQAGSWEEYLNLLCARAEEFGVLVMRSSVVGNDTTRPLSTDEFQGFSIADELAPVVFINAADFKAAQTFTLIHELAHIWIGKAGIDAPDAGDVETRRNSVEGFCNSVASEVLIPEKDFLSAWPTKRNDQTVQKIAHAFWVSTLVVLRRAYELNQITRDEFEELRAEERKKQSKHQRIGGGDHFRNALKRHGRNLTEAVLGDTRKGTLVYRDAASLLDLKVHSLVKMINMYR